MNSTMRLAVLGACMLGALAAPMAPSTKDLRRAQRKVPGPDFYGKNFFDMVEKLNTRLSDTVGLSTKPCDQFNASEIIQVQRVLHSMRDPKFEAIYQKTDDNRRLGAFGSHTDSLQELEALWGEEQGIHTKHPELHDVSRDTKCHEAVMWFVHHLSEDAKEEAAQAITLPLLSLGQRTFNENMVQKGSAHHKVMLGYQQGLGCVYCHAKQPTHTGNKMHANWPEELEYYATGFGPFPFWDAGGPGCSSCNVSIGDGIHGAPLHVIYSAKRNSEILMHGACSLASFKGPGTWQERVPCNHLFTTSGLAYIYTPKAALQPAADPAGFCCKSYSGGKQAFGTGAPPVDWMKMMTYKGVEKSYRGAFYKGPIKAYTLSAPFSFWYYTAGEHPTEFGAWEKPVEQGEGCRVPEEHPPKEPCYNGLPVTLYHDYNYSSFVNATWSDDTFAIPDICKNTVHECTAPGSGGPDAAQYSGVLSLHARMAGVGGTQQ